MKEKKYVLGIDLGTTNCCVCYYKGGVAHVIEDGPKRTTESLVAYEGDQKYVGEGARSRMGTIPVFGLTKLVIGRSEAEIKKLHGFENLPFKVKTVNDKVVLTVDGVEKSAIQVAADELSYLKSNAEKKLGCQIDDAVITVPAHFNDEQRQATKQAAEIAGLNVLRMINEPTAAAVAYGVDKPKVSRTIMVYDFGGGTFDNSILQISDDVYEVLATNGDLFLGGSHLDSEVRKVLVESIKKSYGFDPLKSTFNSSKLSEVSEMIKKDLSGNPESSRSVLLMNDAKIVNASLTFTRANFERLAKSYVQRTVDISNQTLAAAEKKTGSKIKIDVIVLVGGSTRIPLVKEMLQTAFSGVPIDASVNPDEVVAIGAAIQGAQLAGDQSGPDLLLLDVTPLSLGIETQGGVMAKLVEANATIPIQKSQVFTTAADNQTTVSIRVFQGERTMCNDNKLIGSFDLSGIPAARAGVPQIEVSFDIDANGILNVSAKDKASGKAHSVKIQTKGSLSKDEIEKMKAEAEQYKDEDNKRLELATKKNDCERLIISVESQMQDNKDKIPSETATSIEEQIKNLRAAIDSSSVEDMTKYEQELSKSSSELYEVLSKNSGNSDNQSNPEPEAAA
jgi:molecular chaperone DnaK